MTELVTIALDAMGSDQGPSAIIEGARAAIARGGVRVLACGPIEALTPIVAGAEGIEIVDARTVIGYHDDPVDAVRTMHDASVVTAARLVRDGAAQATVSAGVTGAVLAAALFELRRIPGVLRPALAQALPSPHGPVAVLDLGATPDCKPQQLHQFAHMGTAFAHCVLGVAHPRVGLLSNGTEIGKGNRVVLEAYDLIAADPDVDFHGNIEGRDVPLGTVDVVVTDGFTGNVVLKVMEGTGSYVLGELRNAAHGSLRGKVGGFLLKPKLAAFRKAANPDSYGGSYFLGLRGVAVKAHGSASSEGIANAITYAARGVREHIVEQVESHLGRSASAEPEGIENGSV